MAFVVSHPREHGVTPRVVASPICPDKPIWIWIGVGGTHVYLSREEAAQLAADLRDEVEALPVAAQQVSA